MFKLGLAGVVFVLGLFVLSAMIETVDTGHEAVGTRFGKVTGDILEPGFHLVNPLLKWDHFNVFNSTMLFETIAIPAADQQKATMDISIQVRLLPGAALALRESTGDESRVWQTHFYPNARGILRDAGRNMPKVEMFYDAVRIEAYQSTAIDSLTTALGPLGFEITDVIVRDVSLPSVIADAIVAKKQREQEVEKERAELERVGLAAQKVEKQAIANLAAAKLDAQAVRVAASAEAFAIQQKTEQLSPEYISYIKASRWDGAVPKFQGVGASGVLLNLGDQ